MWPLIGALATGAMGLVGGAMQNSSAQQASRDQMEFQERANEKQMAFQKQSASEQYQVAMKDMRAAGLNPMLAYKQGGAGTLSGSTSAGSSYTPQNIGAAAAQAGTAGYNSALQGQRQTAELANIAADTQLKASQDKTQTALQVQAMAQAGQANANSALMTQNTINAFNEEEILRQAISINNPKRIIAEHDARFWSSPAAAPLLATRRLMESLNPSSMVNSAANVVRAGR